MNMKSPAKLTENCFKDFWYRDSDFDHWLPKKQPAQEGEITVLTLGKQMTFLEMAQEFLGTQDPKEIKKYCLTLPMIEEMVKNHSVELDTNGYGNFAFVDNGDPDGENPVSVAHVYRGDGARPWYAYVYELANSACWRADDRLMVCNLDTKKLCSSEETHMTTKTLILGKKPALKGVEVSSWAKELLAKTTYSKKKETLNLVITTPAELGFTDYPTTTQLYARAKEKGYDLCPAEVGPQLAGTLEEVGWIFVGMEPVADSVGDPLVFAVRRLDDGEQWLRTGWSHPGGQWGLDIRIVFRLRKPLDSDTQSSELALSTLDSSAVELDHEARIAALEEQLTAIRSALLNI